MVASTVSIAARCPRSGQLGVGAVTAMLGVGKLVAHAEAGVGAVATQATMNPYHAFDGLRLMSAGHDAGAALERVIAEDGGRDVRQTAMVDAGGRAAAWTGRETFEWAGDEVRRDVCVQGNRLVGPEVLDAMLAAHEDRPDAPLVERLLAALEAAERAGADRAGELSAALFVVEHEEYPLWDLRVDHAEDPVGALRDLFEVSVEKLLPHLLELPRRGSPPAADRRIP